MTPRLLYEPLTTAHGPLLFPALSADEVWRFIGDSEATSPEALAENFARRAAGPPPECPGERWVNFAVRLPAGTYCGRVEATVHGDWAELAYLFGPAYWGQGLATEAVCWLREHFRDHFAVTELWAATQPGNLRSRQLLARLGFVESPMLRPMLSADEGDVVMRWPPAASPPRSA